MQALAFHPLQGMTHNCGIACLPSDLHKVGKAVCQLALLQLACGYAADDGPDTTRKNLSIFGENRPSKQSNKAHVWALTDLSSALAFATVLQATSCTPGMDWKYDSNR